MNIHIISLFTIFMFLSNISYSNTIRNSDSLYGNVKEYNKISYAVIYKFGEPITNTNCVEIKQYNSNGYIISYINSDLEYDLSNNISYEYIFNSNSLLIDMTEYDNIKQVRKVTKYKYNIDNKLIEDITYDDNGDKIDKTIYKYDKNGHKIQSIVYFSDYTLTFYTKYSKDGNIIEQGTKSSKSKYGDKILLRYDNNYIYSDSIFYGFRDNNYTKYKSVSTKDHKNIETTVFSSDNNIKYKIKYKYKNNLLVEETSYFNDNSIKDKSLYKYDNHGNIIEEVKYSLIEDELLLTEIIYSSYTYFD